MSITQKETRQVKSRKQDRERSHMIRKRMTQIS